MMLVGGFVLALSLSPLAAVLGWLLVHRPRACEAINLTAATITLVCALPIPFLIDDRALLFWGAYIVIDRAAAWVILCTAIVYLIASIYAVGYMRLLGENDRLFGFYALFAGFGLTTLIAPLMNNIGLYWVAIELTTIVSTFLVAFAPALWKA